MSLPLECAQRLEQRQNRKKELGKHAYATEVRCRKDPEMDRVEKQTNPCHLQLDRSGSSQAWESQGAIRNHVLADQEQRGVEA